MVQDINYNLSLIAEESTYNYIQSHIQKLFKCVYICVCVCVCVYIYIYICVCVCVCVCVYIYTHTHTHTHLYIHIYIYIHLQVQDCSVKLIRQSVDNSVTTHTATTSSQCDSRVPLITDRIPANIYIPNVKRGIC